MLVFYVVLVCVDLVLTAKKQAQATTNSSTATMEEEGKADLLMPEYQPRANRKWKYGNEDYWPGHFCKAGVGKRQSPINIRTPTVVMDTNKEYIKYKNLRLRGYQTVLVSGINNGRTIQFTTDGDEAMHPTLTGGPLRYLYRLEQLHFHWLSEHAVNGFKYPMELHFVHIRADLTTNVALRKRDGIAIIAVFANIKSETENDDNFVASDMLEEVTRQLPRLSAPGDRVNGVVLNMTKMLPGNHESYVTYAGSLTSPECNEVVTWIILDTPVFMTYGQYKDFVSATKIRYNFRHLQPHNLTVYRPPTKRMMKPVMFRVFDDMYESVLSFFRSLNKMFRSSGPILV